ncbi:hypothetical protein [Streptomyces kronopolitis]|uniref:hypothetical protein n=1 Tax=Streptomyces kronopolitis TaxID=1612435 RepID=UPI0020BD80E1|nr:hypothetical protein [Streptomyces kronopolitis]MCL6302598.1 hypothetical protein [Streptomyces kronopolitis]
MARMLNRGTGGHGLGGLLANWGATERETALSAKYGVRIGPPPDRPNGHFSHSMLDRIDRVLADLPPEHLRGNPELTAIQPAAPGGDSAASVYDGTERAITMVNPFGMPSWLYTELNRSSGLQRWLMDKGALSDYEGISRAGDQALGLCHQTRQVMGGTSSVLAHGNLVKWTIRHEVGHSVDQRVGWQAQLKQQARFGGWQTYGPDGDFPLKQVATAILGKAGLGSQLEVKDRWRMPLLESVTAALNPRVARDVPERLADLIADFADQTDEFREHLDQVIRFVQLALVQPWTLNDGGGDALAIDGRVYHVDHFGQWVSYLRQERTDHALSNYQFSTPAEWFAEAYAAFYDPKPGPCARLNPQVRAWFESELPASLRPEVAAGTQQDASRQHEEN